HERHRLLHGYPARAGPQGRSRQRGALGQVPALQELLSHGGGTHFAGAMLLTEASQSISSYIFTSPLMGEVKTFPFSRGNVRRSCSEGHCTVAPITRAMRAFSSAESSVNRDR